jgi:predicted nicotinamide N-methyase
MTDSAADAAQTVQALFLLRMVQEAEESARACRAARAGVTIKSFALTGVAESAGLQMTELGDARAHHRTFDFPHRGTALTIREIPAKACSRTAKFDETGGGCFMWEGGIALCAHIMNLPQEFQGKSVLDLGSGLGLTALCAATLADSVLVTDNYRPELLENLQYTLSLNAAATAGCEVRVRHLDWRVPDTFPDETFDIVIGSDLAYFRHCREDPLLMAAVGRLLKPGGVFHYYGPVRPAQRRKADKESAAERMKDKYLRYFAGLAAFGEAEFVPAVLQVKHNEELEEAAAAAAAVVGEGLGNAPGKGRSAPAPGPVKRVGRTVRCVESSTAPVPLDMMHIRLVRS